MNIAARFILNQPAASDQLLVDIVNYEIQLYPNPIAPVDVFCIDTGDSTGGVNSASFTWVNPQILRPLGTSLPVYTQNGASAAPAAGWLNKVNQTTACIQDAYAGFQQSYQETRLLYASLTGIQIAPSLIVSSAYLDLLHHYLGLSVHSSFPVSRLSLSRRLDLTILGSFPFGVASARPHVFVFGFLPPGVGGVP